MANNPGAMGPNDILAKNKMKIEQTSDRHLAKMPYFTKIAKQNANKQETGTMGMGIGPWAHFHFSRSRSKAINDQQMQLNNSSTPLIHA